MKQHRKLNRINEKSKTVLTLKPYNYDEQGYGEDGQQIQRKQSESRDIERIEREILGPKSRPNPKSAAHITLTEREREKVGGRFSTQFPSYPISSLRLFTFRKNH